MLETKNLVKIYKPKKGVPVTALNKVSLRLPDKGMVFLLGKSGSGKSTLLNVLGGLDNYNGGEIIIKGVSSKQFKQGHFDSYRNTYVGFIFQEYNILDDFTVGANIALAIELQNRKATDNEVNEILKEVDLEGYANRKPNELSGGQKQRVAIARALVKKPEIIMADEPTGALDSGTGKQILETLKRLSRNKLVLVVSHDREFAETYADRIIELSDGKVISDVELDNSYLPENEGPEFEGNVVKIPCGYRITEQDREMINEYIKALGTSCEINIQGKKTKRFKNTDETKIAQADGSGFKLIKSKLPLKNAFKIGASSLKHKKIRLVITVILSCISFGLFGLSDTFAAYNHVETCTNSLVDSNINYMSVAKSKKIGSGVNGYWRTYGYKLSENDLKELKSNTNTTMYGVFAPINTELNINENIDTSVKLTESDYDIFSGYLSGYATVNEDIMNDLGFSLLAGTLPDGNKDEIAISEYLFEVFKRAKYTDGTTVTKADGRVEQVFTEIENYNDIIGKKVRINNVSYTVSAVVDTKLDIERYISLTEKKESQTNAEKLVDYVLYDEFSTSRSYSYAGVAMVGDGYLERLIANRAAIRDMTEGYLNFYQDDYSIDSGYLASLADVKNEKIIWVDGEKQSLGEKEIVVTTDVISIYGDVENYFTEEGDIDYVKFVKEKGELNASKYYFGDNENVEDTGYKIVGIINLNDPECTVSGTVICNDDLLSQFTEGKDNIYSYAVGTKPSSKEELKALVAYCYREDSTLRYQIQNSVTYELDSVNDLLKAFATVFLYVGLGFALFAALMLANFIATSITYKKQEIGILRAIGSRSNDVFRIFFAESFIIAMINFVLSALGVFAVTEIINYVIRNNFGILITVLNFGIRQVVLLLAVSIAVAFVASFLPVKKIASKRPIDAIRNR